MTHIPVLVKEVVEAVPEEARRIIDATVGAGGHGEAMLKKARRATLLGIDQDETMLVLARRRLERYADRVNLALANFRDLPWAANEIGWEWADIILFDLGVSSPQLADPQRGLSFQSDGPLDMRLDRSQTLTAATIVNKWKERDLVHLFKKIGEEPYASRIARQIGVARREKPLATTRELVQVIAAAIPARRRLTGNTHFATNVFRALRMAVNDELGALREALPAAIRLLAPGGKLLVISFHSLEDRIVKQTFREAVDLEVVTKKPISAGSREVEDNPRARSAKLRIARKIIRE